MTREMFLSQLRMHLQGKVSSDKIQENINYYSEYIIEEIRKGKSEKDVFEMLGDPSLLAKTIIAADDAGKQGENAGETGYAAQKEQSTGTTGYFNGRQVHMAGRYKWWQKLLFVLAVVMVVLLIIAIVSGVIRILVPLVVPIAIVMIVVRILRRRR